MIRDLHRVIELIENNWEEAHVVVVGDVMLDRYIWGEVERISPEAPVPVVRAGHRTEQPGGAANVAMNIAELGGQVTLLGFCGDDSDATILEARLRQTGITSRMTTVAGHPTTSKLRILGGKQQMLRLDVEKTSGYPAGAYKALLSDLDQALSGAQVVVLSDYAKGVLSEELCREAIRMARDRSIPVLVDPKHRNFARYRGASTICPNLHELSTASGVPAGSLDTVLRAGQEMVPQLDVETLTVTLSEKGIAVLREDSCFISPAAARQVFDVSGAGDTVIATLALARACNLEIESAVQLANIAAGIVVSKVGTVPVSRDELLASLTREIELHAEEKVLPLDRLMTRVAAWRSMGQSVVFTNGCFDLLHIGHITLLQAARREGDRLVVAINSDTSVRNLKGPARPVVGEEERARILAALTAVDAVVIFEESTPLRLIEALRPDVLVKGGDYTEETIVGASEVTAWGGRVKIVPTVEGFSTTELIARATTPMLQ
jgi:D-beta-D-heptose 7-phosphate kinase / D-beta-D-heptose 1-phosphate adenosyltransferase